MEKNKKPKKEIAKYKKIKCKTCGVDCLSGKRQLCDTHYAEYISSRSKVKPKAALRPMSTKAYSLSNIQVLYQKFARLCSDGKCVSCGVNGADNGGHLIAKGKSSHVALLITNIYPQCSACNNPAIGDGMPKKLMAYGLRFWGKGAMEKLITLSGKPYQFNQAELIEQKEKIEECLRDLEHCVSEFDKQSLLISLYHWQKSRSYYE